MQSNSLPIIELKNISKVINKRTIINNISLSINKGEIFGLLGSNGAGKTTIIKMLTGLISPTNGEITIDGITIKDNYEKYLENIGAIIEYPALYTHLSGYLNLKIMANMFVNIDNNRIKEVAEIVGLSNRLNDKVKTYSLGMKQRLGIAISLLNNPKILILDEPLNGLDPQGVREMRELFIKLSHELDVCIIISSHILSEMELVCDRFSILTLGVIDAPKSLIETLNTTKQTFTFNLLTPVNPIELEKIVTALNIKLISLDADKFTISQTNENISKLINLLVNNNINIVSVIPHRKSLEDYFIQSMEEGKNE